ncbi:MAG: DUF1127 domain-containing protein [Pseudomonadota bacterium]
MSATHYNTLHPSGHAGGLNKSDDNTHDVLQNVIDGLNFVKKAYEIARQRHHLLNLEEHQLRDIGLTKDQVARETQRSFWDVPVQK